MKRLLLSCVMAALTLAGCGAGQFAPKPTLIPPPTLDPQGGNVRGVFLAGDAPLATREVMLSRVVDYDDRRFTVTQITLTNERGEFVFTGVAPGTYVVSLAMGLGGEPGSAYQLNPERLPRGYVLTEDETALRLLEVESGTIVDVGEVRFD